MSTWYDVAALKVELLDLAEAVRQAAALGIDPAAAEIVLARRHDPAAGVLRLRLRIDHAHPDASTPDMDPVFVTRLLAEQPRPEASPLAALYPDLWSPIHGGHIGHHNAVVATFEEECTEKQEICTVFVPAQLAPGVREGSRWDSAAWAPTGLFPPFFPAGRGLLAAEPARYLPLPEDDDLGGFGSLAFSPDGSRLAGVSFHGRLRVWDAASGEEVYAEDGLSDGRNHRLAFAGGSLLISLVDDEVQVRDGRTFAPLSSLPAGSRELIALPDGRALAQDAAGVQRLDPAARAIEDLLTQPRGDDLCFDAIACAPQAGLAAAHASDLEGSKLERSRIWLWDLASGAAAGEIDAGEGGDEAFALCIAGEPPNVYKATWSALRGWDARTGERILSEEGEGIGIHLLASRDGGLLIVPLSNRRAPGYQRADGTSYRHSDCIALRRPGGDHAILRYLPVRNAEVHAVALSPDGRTLAVATDQEVILYEVPPGF